VTGRERLTAVLSGQRPDRLAWTILADDNTLGALEGRWAGLSAIQFARRLGADSLVLNGWGTPYEFASPAMVRGDRIVGQWQDRHGRTTWRVRTPAGELTAEFERGHPRKYPVGNLAELRIYRSIWEATRFEPRDDAGNFAAIDALVGDDGVVARFWGPSTVPRLLQYDMGTENFYYLLADHPAEMAELLDLMHRVEMQAFEALAAGPCDVIILVENTSTYYVSPEVYERFNGRHVADFVDVVHAAGKTAILHMCGHIRALLPLIKQTNSDGIHALTPPPIGDTPWETALDALGDDLIIIGAFDPNVLLTGPVEEMGPHLDALYTPRLRRSNVILCCFADGITVPIDRFEAVAAWFERNGELR